VSPGGSSGNLANLIVQFVTQGQKEVKQSLDDIQMAIGAVVLAVQKMNFETTKALENIKTKNKEVVEQTNKLALAWQTVATTAKTSLAIGVTSITGFVTAGLAAGVMGQQLGFHMERLALTISGLFRPEIMKVIDLVRQLTDWLHSLTESQKTSLVQFVAIGAAALAFATGGLAGSVAGVGILGLAFKDLGPSLSALVSQLLRVAEAMQPLIDMIVGAITPAIDVLTAALASMSSELLKSVVKWAAAITTFIAVLTVIPKVVAAIQTVVAVLRSLNIAQTIMLALSGPKGWAQLAAGAAAAGAALTVFFGIEQAAAAASEAAKKKGVDIGRFSRGMDMPRNFGQFEDLQETYRRIATASIRATVGLKSPEQLMLEEQAKANEHLRKIEDNTGRQKSPIGR
jgi:hypothetical protein